MGLHSRLRVAKLMLVTDARAATGDFRDVVVAALRGGVDLVQVRDAQATAEQLADALEVARSACAQLNAMLVVGHDVAAAQRLGADVLHLGAAQVPTAQARAQLHEHALVGRSAHHGGDLDQVDSDYLFIGPVFGDARPDDGIDFPGLGLVREAAQRMPVSSPTATPWFAVGGITAENLPQVVDAGALRVAVSGAITRADDPEKAAAELKAILQQAWDARPEMERYTISALGGGSARFLVDE